MNIVLVESPHTTQRFQLSDRVYSHVSDTLRMHEGDVFDVGLINGPRGKAKITAFNASALEVDITWGRPPETIRPVIAFLGLSRPQTVQKQLNVLATLGVAKMIFFPTARGEPSYAKSRVWREGLWKRHVLEGVEQAFSTQLPEVELLVSLEEALEAESRMSMHKFVLDNYESSLGLGEALSEVGGCDSAAVAVGSERGWTAEERKAFRQFGFIFAHLGPRVMRCETAAAVALSRVLGWV